MHGDIPPIIEDTLNVLAQETIYDISSLKANGDTPFPELQSQRTTLVKGLRAKVQALCEGEFREQLLPLITDELDLPTELQNLASLLGASDRANTASTTRELVNIVTKEILRRIANVTIEAHLETNLNCTFALPITYPTEFTYKSIGSLELPDDIEAMVINGLQLTDIRSLVHSINTWPWHPPLREKLIIYVKKTFDEYRANNPEGNLRPLDLRDPLPEELRSVTVNSLHVDVAGTRVYIGFSSQALRACSDMELNTYGDLHHYMRTNPKWKLLHGADDCLRSNVHRVTTAINDGQKVQ